MWVQLGGFFLILAVLALTAETCRRYVERSEK